MKNSYIPLLLTIGERIGFEIAKEDITNDEKAAQIINDYLKGNNFVFTPPCDNKVYLNKNVYKYISARMANPKNPIQRIGSRFAGRIYSIMPTQIKGLISPDIKKFFKKILNMS